MKSKLFLSLTLLAIILNCKGQYTYVTPVPHQEASCEVMVNELSSEYFRDDLKRAVFRLSLTEANGAPSSCTGTMINRNTDLGHLGQYFVTAWHCFKSGATCGGSVFDFANQYVTLTFNYQSTIDEGGLVFSPNQTGSVYSITRKVRLVDHVECGYGDFAICEILGDPIPPYYNVYYAGWNPNGLFLAPASDYAVIHHPMGDIKSMAIAHTVINNGTANPASLGCRVVTKIIDVIFGWIWGHKWSTEVLCGYLDVPFAGTEVTVPSYVNGLVEEGSSGSALLSSGNRMIGDLSAVVNTSCSGTNTSFYGKLSNSYYRQSVKNAMNPSNSWQVDQSGIAGRDMTCYPQVSLDPGSGPDFILYPAGLYQAYNHIDIVSQTTFTTASNKNVVVKANSSFTFQAGQSITFNPGFKVENGAEFNAVISPSPCSLNTSSYETRPEFRTPNQLDGVAEPVFKKFDINKYIKDSAANITSNFTHFNVYPNPSGGVVNIDLFLKTLEPQVDLILYDLNGRPVYSRKFTNLYYLKQPLDLPQLPAGMYNLIVRTGREVNSRRIVVMH